MKSFLHQVKGIGKVSEDSRYPNLGEDSGEDQVGEAGEEEADPVEAEDVEEMFEVCGVETVEIWRQKLTLSDSILTSPEHFRLHSK